jgi:nicotinate-nucleotide adenylyltransferase
MGGVRIALFGGSFDPPHWGHVLAAAWALVAGRADRVWVLPAHHHPYGKPLSPWDQRWALCQAAFAGLGRAEVRDDERRNPSGFTIDLVTALRDAHPGNHWLLVGGTDTARDLRNWHRGQELERMIEVIAVPRRGYDEHPAALPAISSTAVRERLAHGERVEELVPPAVAELIAAHGWYRRGGGD